MAFRTYLQPRMYERTLQPQPPFDAAFPPEVRVVTVSEGKSFDTVVLSALDVTRGTEPNPQSPPKFDITRTDGLDGWTAYLRDTTTGRILSNVRPLSGTLSQGILLATNHVPSGVDALTNADLVVAPPVATPVPTGVFHPVVPTSGSAPIVPSLPAQLTYRPLPPPLMVSGSIATEARAPVLADLTFEALGISECQDTSCTGTQLNTTNFEFFTSARTRTDSQTGASTYAVVLPPGTYQVVVRPFDVTSAVTTEFFRVDAQMKPLTGRDIRVYDRQRVQGNAVVADGRALSGATVEAIALTCFGATGAPTAGSCLPRGGQTTTLVDGSFGMNLDPGGYILRVRPAEGTRLPWVSVSQQVPLGGVTVPPLTIPVPMDVSHLLLDPQGNAIIRALVRVFSLPPGVAGAAGGPAASGALAARAVELGRAITDVSGQYEMYLAPPAQ